MNSLSRLATRLVIVAFSASSAIGQTVDMSKVCLDDNKVESKAYPQALMSTWKIEMPGLVLSAPTSAGEARCDLGRMSPADLDGFKKFDDAAAACGFQQAVVIALAKTYAAYPKGKPVSKQEDEFCYAGSNPDKAPQYCAAIKSLRAEISVQMEPGSDDVPRVEGSYRLKLGDGYGRATRPQQRIYFMQYLSVLAGGPGVSQARPFEIMCGPRKASGPDWKLGDAIRIAKDSESIQPPINAKDGRKSRKAAELALSYDRESRDSSGNYKDKVTFNGALGYDLSDILFRGGPDKMGFRNDSVLTAYVALEYDQKPDPTAETDNLFFGLRFTPQLGWNTSHIAGNPSLDVSWVTDIEQRESAQWLATLSAPVLLLDDQLDDLLPPWVHIKKSLAFDYTHVVHIGDKTSLELIGEMFRLGFDADVTIDLDLFKYGDFTPTLKAGYKERWAIDDGSGDASILALDLKVAELSSEKGGIGLSLAYNHGINLTSLEDVENYTAKLEFKN